VIPEVGRAAVVVVLAVLVASSAGCGRSAGGTRVSPPSPPSPGAASVSAGPSPTSAERGSYRAADDFCGRLDLGPARRVAPTIKATTREPHGVPGDSDFLECEVHGDGGRAVGDIMVMGIDVRARIFARAGDARESYVEARDDPATDCKASPVEVASLGSQASEAHCVEPTQTNVHLLHVLDGNLDLEVETSFAASGKVPATSAVAAMNVAIARSALEGLRTP
jgi:hypothetical protein